GEKSMRHLWLVLIISLCELSCIHDTCTADDGLTTASPPTVALLQVGDSDKPLADAMGLLEATLLESDELKMVERERLAAVLEELELSSSQLAIDGVTAVQLGRLLKADLLVWVGKPPQA